MEKFKKKKFWSRVVSLSRAIIVFPSFCDRRDGNDIDLTTDL